MTDDLLTAGWRQVTSNLGAFTKFGKPVAAAMQGHTIVDVPMAFAGGPMKGRVAFDSAGRIAGLFILNPDVA